MKPIHYIIYTFTFAILTGMLTWWGYTEIFPKLPNGNFKAIFLKVNNGDATLFQTPHGKEIFVDGGDDISVLREMEKYRPFWDRYIDVLIITHPDKDHYGGAIEILKRYKVPTVIMTGALKSDPYYNELFRVIEENDIRLIFADKHTDFEIDGVIVNIIFPFNLQYASTKSAHNNFSLVFMVEYGGKKILMTGDIEQKTETLLLSEGIPLRADILKIAHHGSKTSSTENFLHSVRPKHAIIPTGTINKFGHPHIEVLNRLRNLDISYENVRDRSIKIEWNNGRID